MLAVDGSYGCVRIADLYEDNQLFSCTLKNFTSTDSLTMFLNQNMHGYLTIINEHNYNGYNGDHVGKINFEYTDMKEISSNLFQKFSSLWEVNLSNVGLETIHRDNFQSYVGKIEVLNLSKNKLAYLGNMIFSSLEALTDLDLSDNMIADYHDGAFDACCSVLKNLNLKSNKIKQIKPTTLSNFNTLTLLDLSENNIVEIGGIANEKISYIEKLNLSNNDITEFDCELQISVKSLILNFNHIKSVSMNACNVSILYASNNEIEEFSINENVYAIVATNNKITQLNVDRNSKLTHLDIGRNELNASILEIIKDMEGLRYLDLSQNNLGPISLETFSKFQDLTNLNLSDTKISNLEYGTFSHQINLQVLDLSKNNLNHIDLNIFTSLQKLHSFYLSGNNLNQIDNVDEIKKFFPLLKLISFSNNNWNCSYLAKMFQAFTLNKVDILYERPLVRNSTNIMGIGCNKSTTVGGFIIDVNGNICRCFNVETKTFTLLFRQLLQL